MNPELEHYKEKVKRRLADLRPIFSAAAMGDFSEDVPIYEEEDEFSEFYLGIQIMIEVIRGQLQTMQELNYELESKVIELEKQMSARKQLEQRKDEFITVLGHELRNPLAPIVNAIKLIKMADDGGMRPEHRKLIAIIDRQSSHMARLIRDLLDVSRIVRGKIELKPEPLDVREIIANALDTAGPAIAENNHELETDISHEPIIVSADPMRLEQVIVNILNNAAKYTSSGGRIGIRAWQENGRALIHIKDSGIGIEPELLGKIFELFAQGDQDLTAQKGGLGIGLGIAKNLTKLHGGDVRAASEGPGKGSTFTIELPLLADGKLPERMSAAADTSRTEALPQQKRILIIDDNQDLADTLGDILRELGQDARTAYDGLSALEIARNWEPDIIFLDIAMPQMDGYAVAKALRESGCMPKQLVALTGFGQESDIEHSHQSGFSQHLVKPPSIADLMHILTTEEPAAQ